MGVMLRFIKPRPSGVQTMEMTFCYCCRLHHPRDEMRLFETRRGLRWRCIRSIEAAARSLRERDAFGRQQSDINRQALQHAAETRKTLNRLNARLA